ncbi:MAG: helix-turn-helix transcriptional regulator [Deltaproteobacteria bacterium]|nr:helix-turn-helix transcriptional regulator [Deltaproteobacteria bacterium]
MPMTSPLLARLRQERLKQKISTAAVGQAIDLAQSMVSAAEHGSRDPKLGHVEAWASMLGFDLALVARTGPELGARQQLVLDLMREVLTKLPESDLDLWEAELRIRRRQLGLAPDSKSNQ